MSTADPLSLPPAPPDRLRCVLLAGQSNMAGRGAVDQADRIPHPRILSLNHDHYWVPAIEPLHWDKPAIVGVGPGLAFARALVERQPTWRVGLIPCAVGGTTIAQWHADGALYASAVARAHAAQRDGELTAILWHQGESDARDAASAIRHGVALIEMLTRLRGDLGANETPLLIATLGDFLDPAEYPEVASINAGLAQAVAALSCATLVSAAGLKHGGDRLHFSAEAARELGRRYATAFTASL